MATADEILAGAVEVASEDVTQDKVLRIDNELRTIAIPSAVRLLGVESDDDVNRLEFEMPRHYGEFDLSTFFVRVNYMNANGDGDIYKVTDLVADEEKMTFSWLVGRTAFMYKGDVQFAVCLKKIAENFVIEQEFNTTVVSLPVLQGLEPDEHLMQRYPDIIEQILKYMETPVSSEEIGKAVEEYLKENPAGGATINDEEVSAGSVWSSQKTSSQIDEKVSDHNTDQTTHTDIRNLIVGLTNRLNALADSDDTTLDQLSEIVTYIKSNKGLIDAITTSKVSVSDIVDDLVTNSSDKPLSAAQGVKLKALIDAIVPVTVDAVLSSTSTNPVQNKVVLSGLNEKENKGAARSVQIGSETYQPNERGVITLPEQSGSGLPNGGTAGQVLAKASDADHDAEWIDPPSGSVTAIKLNDETHTPDPNTGVVDLGTVDSGGVNGVMVNGELKEPDEDGVIDLGGLIETGNGTQSMVTLCESAVYNNGKTINFNDNIRNYRLCNGKLQSQGFVPTNVSNNLLLLFSVRGSNNGFTTYYAELAIADNGLSATLSNAYQTVAGSSGITPSSLSSIRVGPIYGTKLV